MAGDISRENGRKNTSFGRPKLEATKLREALYRKVEENADALSDVIINKAKKGDVPAWKEIADRVFGRPSQAVDVTSGGKELPQPILTGIIAAPAQAEEKSDQP